MQKAWIGILAIATVGLSVVCALQWRQLKAARVETLAAQEALKAEGEAARASGNRVRELERVEARLQKQVEDFTKVTTNLRAQEAKQTSNVAAMARQMASTKSRGSTGSGPGENGGGLGKGMGEMLGKMMKDPAMREMMRDQQKATIKMMYSGLFKELNLTPEEKDKFTSLLTESQLKAVEAAQAMFGGDKKDGSLQQAQKQLEETKKQIDADVKVLLGDERFAQYTDYQKNIGERMQIDQFSSRLQAANLPLQEQQTAQIFQIMKEEKALVPPVIPSDATQSGKNLEALMTPENVEKQMQWTEDYNRRVQDRLAQVLTPEQLKEYRDFQEQQASMQKLGLTMARQMFGGDKSGAGAPNAAPAQR